jgi:hypothetical protein
MILTELSRVVAQHGSHLAALIAGSVANEPKTINTDAVLSFLVTKITPLLLGVLGIIFIGRAGKGEVSKVLTSSAIAIIGLVFLAGAASLFFLGDSLVQIAFK